MVMYVYFKIQIIWTEIEGSPQILTFAIEKESGKLSDFYFVSFLCQKLRASACTFELHDLNTILLIYKDTFGGIDLML